MSFLKNTFIRKENAGRKKEERKEEENSDEGYKELQTFVVRRRS